MLGKDNIHGKMLNKDSWMPKTGTIRATSAQCSCICSMVSTTHAGRSLYTGMLVIKSFSARANRLQVDGFSYQQLPTSCQLCRFLQGHSVCWCGCCV